ncbi:hypothetical protein [Bacillus sp. EAC]|uniref:hypothetical protein n=1 Tax=Bacillus sp. EAC TaxID=1978338 RepID=UPI0015C50887|nr:hypothetical protein [Bacillus sp. EAC]
MKKFFILIMVILLVVSPTLNFLDDDLTIDYTDGFQIKSSDQIYSFKIGIEIEA